MTNDNFKWTDELIKEMIYHKLPIPNHFIGNVQKCLDDFKATHSSNGERDWEVIEYRVDFLGVDKVRFVRNEYGLYMPYDYRLPNGINVTAENEKEFQRNKHTIHSVLRKSDGVVFSVGDEIDMIECGLKKIDSFLVGGKGDKSGHSEKDLWISTNKNKGYGTLIQYAIKPLPQRTKLFTTEDGVDIFDGERMLFYIAQFKIRERKAKNMAHLDNKRFYNESAAKEYITLNKPCLSVNDILDLEISVFHGFSKKLADENINSLKELAKSKLK